MSSSDAAADTREILSLRDQVIWVVGAGGGGIGTSICRRLAGAGAHVIAIDRDRDALDATLAATESTTGTCTGVVADALDAAALGAACDRQTARSGAPTGLVNVVGGLRGERWGSVLDTADADFDAVFDLNLRSAWNSSRLFGRERVANGGSGAIVQLTSIAALEAMPYGASYAAAKAALISLTRTMALEWGGIGLRVNALAAGSIQVPRHPTTDAERDRRAIPLGRRGKPVDVANAALFLLSSLAEWITGQVLVVDGGASIKPAYLDDQGLPVFVEDQGLRARLQPLRLG